MLKLIYMERLIIMNVYTPVSRDNKKKMEKMMNGNLNQFLKLQGGVI